MGPASLPERKGSVDALPDLTTLSDDDLKQLIRDLEEEENELSYRRRLLHGKIDILRAEQVAREKGRPMGELGKVDVDRLSEILSGKGSPPAVED
jgi:CRISPR/Cas system-associated protein Cas10 (large subunit of type III CRISPR-Cas system)